MSDIYIKQNKPDKALEYASRSLKLAQKYGLKKQISISNEKLSELYQKSGNYENFYKKFIVYKDSLKSIEIVQKQQTFEQIMKLHKKQISRFIESKNKSKDNTNLVFDISFSAVTDCRFI
jgi:tetratricopeptide (TPR) repeat protein